MRPMPVPRPESISPILGLIITALAARSAAPSGKTRSSSSPTRNIIPSIRCLVVFICAPTAAGYASVVALPGVSQTNLSILKQLKELQPWLLAVQETPCQQLAYPRATNPVASQLGEIDFTPKAFNNTYTTANSLDFNLSQKDQIRVRYIYQKNDSTDTAANIPSFFTRCRCATM